jgi:hypothetical protein
MDFSQFRLPTDSFQDLGANGRQKRKRGPAQPGSAHKYAWVPWGWFLRVTHLPQPAVVVAVCLCRESSRQGGGSFPFRLHWLTRYGIPRSNVSRGLAALERVGLVAVERRPGLPSLVTVLDAEASGGSS